jgi:hypothetical protein
MVARSTLTTISASNGIATKCSHNVHGNNLMWKMKAEVVPKTYAYYASRSINGRDKQTG